MRLKISARKSDLARLQATMVGEKLKATIPSLNIDYRFKETLGDKNLTDPLWKMPEKGVFTEDFTHELMLGNTDMVVHSWKDLPTERRIETAVVATLPRADQRDLLLVKTAHFKKCQSSKTMHLFSASPRRAYNLTDFFKTHLPFDLESVTFENVRGNIPTRLRKLLETTKIDGLVLAKAALDRLLSASQTEFKAVQGLLRHFLSACEWMVLPLSVNPNAAAQGALAIEILASRTDLVTLLAPINHPPTYACAQKERNFLANLGGGCHQKIGIAVVNRHYGEITYLKGLSDQGQVLDQRTLTLFSEVPQFFAHQMWCHPVHTHRQSLQNWQLPSGTNALYVARSSAWPEFFNFCGVVWVAGLKTWHTLAQKGVWVHGSSDGLGEQEDPCVEILAGVRLKWAKLSHDRAASTAGNTTMPLVATYTINRLPQPSCVAGKEAFFWRCGSQFIALAEQHPEILSKHHACGPGNTSQCIREYLKEKNALDHTRLHIFLDKEDWKRQCTQ